MERLKELLGKYRLNKLSHEEFVELRRTINSLKNEEILPYIEYVEDSVSPEELEKSLSRIKNKINLKIPETRPSSNFLQSSAVKYAAIFLGLIATAIIGFVVALKFNNTPPQIAYNTVTTGHHSEPKIILSDNTEIKMLPNSTLRYPSSFEGEKRCVEFEGIGFFEVAKNPDKPFIVELAGVEIIVKGTTFTVDARDNSGYTQISLIEGSISLISSFSHENIELHPDFTAILDNKTGEITIEPTNHNLTIDWEKEELQFNNIHPDSLIRQIETYYFVELPAPLKNSINANFTGTLPMNDLNTTMKVLNGIYNQ